MVPCSLFRPSYIVRVMVLCRYKSSDAKTAEPIDGLTKRYLKYKSPGGSLTRLVERFQENALKIYGIFEALSQGGSLKRSDEEVVFELLKIRKDCPPRESLTYLGMALRNDPRLSIRRGYKGPSSPSQNWGHLLPPIYRLAWNDGRDGGDPRAAFLLVRTRDHRFHPPLWLTSDLEAAALVDALRSTKLGYHAQAELVLRKFEDSSNDEREILRERILDLLQKAWDTSGDPHVAQQLSDLYSKGDVLPFDWGKAKLWLDRAAEAGNYPAALELALRLVGESGSPADYAKAHKYFEIAAQRLHEANYRLGLYYLLDPASRFPTLEEHFNHWSVEPDDAQAAQYFLRAHEFGNTKALARLVQMQDLGGLPDDMEAILVQKGILTEAS